MGNRSVSCTNIEDLVSPWDLIPLGSIIAKRSALKKASQWSLKQTITSSSSQDISDLVFDDLVNTDCLEMFLVLFKRSS